MLPYRTVDLAISAQDRCTATSKFFLDGPRGLFFIHQLAFAVTRRAVSKLWRRLRRRGKLGNQMIGRTLYLIDACGKYAP